MNKTDVKHDAKREAKRADGERFFSMDKEDDDGGIEVELDLESQPS